MIAEGRATAARGDLLDLKPLPPVSGTRPLSEVLTDLRADERGGRLPRRIRCRQAARAGGRNHSSPPSAPKLAAPGVICTPARRASAYRETGRTAESHGGSAMATGQY